MSKVKQVKRSYPAKRKYALREDATVESGTQKIERVFNLPKGSVRLELPSGRRARSDKTIGKLKADWNR